MLSVRRSNVFSAAPVLLAAMLAGLGGTAAAQTLGGAGGPAGDATQVEKCDAPKGTLAVVEPQDAVLQSLFNIGLKSPTGMLRVIVQQSNCFQIVERGTGFQNLMQERALAEGGQLQSNQNVGKGQMVAADFVVTPSVVFSNPNAGGVGGALAGFGGKLGMLGALAGGLLGGLVRDPGRYGLDFAFAAVFLALLLPQLRDRKAVAVAVISGVLALIFAYLLPGKWYIVAAGLGASLAGALLERGR